MSGGDDSTALFTRTGDTFIPDERTRGPWSEDAQHGGPVAALVAALIEQHETERGLVTVRITYELVRALPLRPLRLKVHTALAGRSVERVEAQVEDAGSHDIVAVARALRIRQKAIEVPAVDDDPPKPPESCPPLEFSTWSGVGFVSHGMEMRLMSGAGPAEPGPAAVWFRLRQPILAGAPVTPLQRVCATADFGNGISSLADFSEMLFINPDLTIAIHRDAADEWVCLDAATRLNRGGYGLTESRLLDRYGRVGLAHQSLLVARRA